MGRYSKIVLLGSMNQIDDVKQKKKPKCDFQQVVERLQDLSIVGFVELRKSMRSEWCAIIDELLKDMN
jgi:predicted ribonuclease YlaK